MGERLRSIVDPEALAAVLSRLRRTPAGLDPGLARSVPYAVAFHHAGKPTIAITCDDVVVEEHAQGLSNARSV